MNYQKALEKLKSARSIEDGKPLENNTRLVKTSKGIGVRLHETIVVEILKNGHYRLDTGNWFTLTTKDRINNYSPARVFQKNKQWYLGNSIFYNGMIVDEHGEPLKEKKESKKSLAVKAKVEKYIQNFKRAIEKGEMLGPSSGDCWHCLMFDKDLKDLSHVIQHIKENYLVESFLYNCLVLAGNELMARYHYDEVLNEKSTNAIRALRKFFNKNMASIIDAY